MKLALKLVLNLVLKLVWVVRANCLKHMNMNDVFYPLADNAAARLVKRGVTFFCL